MSKITDAFIELNKTFSAGFSKGLLESTEKLTSWNNIPDDLRALYRKTKGDPDQARSEVKELGAHDPIIRDIDFLFKNDYRPPNDEVLGVIVMLAQLRKAKETRKELTELYAKGEQKTTVLQELFLMVLEKMEAWEEALLSPDFPSNIKTDFVANDIIETREVITEILRKKRLIKDESE